MNLDKLFDMQRELDQRIVKEKGLEGQDLLQQKILALQVELGELANEWRGFKFWKEDQTPITQESRLAEDGLSEEWYNPLLEEYVDCLHFILSIGNDLDVNPNNIGQFIHININKMRSITDKFMFINKYVVDLYEEIRDRESLNARVWWLRVTEHFLGLGKIIGFTEEQIETAYLEKNKVNHARQENGY